MEILVAISILGIAATAGYQSFYSIERMQYQAVKATQNIDKPVAAFNQFFAQYNQSEENSTAIEVLDLTPNIDAFINTNRFRLDRVRVLFDPTETSLGLNANPEDLTADLTPTYTFSDGIIAAGFGQTVDFVDPTSFIHQDYIASGTVMLPTKANLGAFDEISPTQTKQLFQMGGWTRGTWIGIAYINGDYFLRMRAGRGTISENDNFSGQDRVIRSIEIDDIPEFDGNQHEITWDIDTGDALTDSPGRIRLWIDNRKVIDASSTCDLTDPLRQCQLGLLNELPAWAGGNQGAWGTGVDSNIPGGDTVYPGPQQFQNTNPWPSTAGTLNVYRDLLIDESAVPSTNEPFITLPLTNLALADSEAIYYRVLAMPNETCKFTGGTNFAYTFDCFDDGDYTLLKEDFDSLMNEDNIPFFDIGMLDGSLCRVVGYDSSTEVLTLDSASNCPASAGDTDPTASPTVYFLPPRLVFYSTDFSLQFVQSVMDSFANPVNKFNDNIASRDPSSF